LMKTSRVPMVCQKQSVEDDQIKRICCDFLWDIWMIIQIQIVDILRGVFLERV